jgi:HK97 family phage portal protein
MGWFDRLLGRPERFSAQWSIGNPAFAEWLRGEADSTEAVTPYTVLGLAAVQRAVSIIATTIAGLPMKTYEKGADGERVKVDSEFDDPYPGIDGMTPFAWVETVLMHLLLWRNAYLWHEARADGTPGIAYRPLHPETILRIKRVNGRKVFEYREQVSTETKEVGTEQITHIPGPSLDGYAGHPLLWMARYAFSGAISAEKTTAKMMRKGIRLAGIVTPSDGEDDFEATEGAAILEMLRKDVLGSENAGDVAVINRKLNLQKWQATNIESQWFETLGVVLMQIEQIFGVPPHLMADTEKQTSWGTGVAEQNLSLSRFTFRGWSDRLEQVFTLRLPDRQFVEFDYKGLLQGTPAEEIKLLILQVESGLMTDDEARRVLNLPPLTPSQRAQTALQKQSKVLDLPGVQNAPVAA